MKKVKEEFKRHHGNFGYRRITMVINRKYKKQYNEKRIRRLMDQTGLKSHIRRSNGYSTKTSYENIEENILNREFTAEKPNEKWVTDITHIHYGLWQ
jgi:putative transposase